MNIRRSRTFLRFFRSFLLLAITISLIFLINNISLIFDVQGTLKNAMTSTMKQIASYSDVNIFEMKRLAEIIGGNSDFTSYNLMENHATPGNIINELDKVKRPFALLANIALVYRNSIYPEINYTIYADSGRYSLDEYCKLVCQNGISQEKLGAVIRDNADPELVLLDTNEKQILYVQPLPVAFLSSPGVLLFHIRGDSFIQNYIPDEYNIAVVSSQNQLLACQGEIYRQNPHLLTDAFSPDDYLDQVVFTEHLANLDLTFYLMTDKSSFYQPLYRSIILFLVLLLIVISSSVILSYFLAQRNYLPIHLLIKKLKIPTDQPGHDRINELDTLSQTFEKLRCESEKIRSEMTEGRTLVRNQLLNAALQYGDPILNTGYAHEIWDDITRGDSYHTVVLIQIDDYSQFRKKYGIKDQLLIKNSLCRLFEESCEVMGQGYAMESEISSMIITLVQTHRNDQHEFAIYALCQQFRKQIKEQYDLTVTCAISDLAESSEAWQALYWQSLQLLKFSFFLGKDMIITSEMIKGFENRSDKLSSTKGEALDKLITLIKSGQTDDISDIIHDLFRDLSTDKHLALFNRTYFHILSELNHLIEDGLREKVELFANQLNILFENNFAAIDEAISTLVYFCEELTRQFLKIQNAPTNRDVYNRIIRFIEKNYASPLITLSSLASEFALNPSYLTRYFKECNGLPLMQYIDKIRFEKSKELLLQTNCSIKEIMDRVGYTDEANFIRKFKKIEGISSSQYRKIYSKTRKEDNS